MSPVRGVLFVLGVAVVFVAFLLWASTPQGSYRLVQSESRRTWVVDVGEPRPMRLYGVSVITLSDPVTFPADELRVHDRFRCERGTHSVHAYRVADWMDERGGSNNNFEEISVTTNLDGSVTVTCWAPGGRPTGPT